MERRDVILIRSPGYSLDNLEVHRVTQRVSSRVGILELSAHTGKEELQAMTGVDAVLEPGERLSGEIRSTLSDSELLFIDAHTQQTLKPRVGEGLDWDAAEFLPPDPPTER